MERFGNAILLYGSYEKVDQNMIKAVIEGLQQWASYLPRMPITDGKRIENSSDLAPEQHEIRRICDEMLLFGQVKLSEVLDKKLSLLLETAGKLDKVYPISREYDKWLEQNLVLNCERQVTLLCRFLEEISRILTMNVKTSVLESMDMAHLYKSPSGGKRDKRTLDIAKLKAEVLRYIKDTAQMCWSKYYSDADFRLPPRPLQKELAVLAGISPVSVSRCFKDPKAVELCLLWNIAGDPEQMMQYVRPT